MTKLITIIGPSGIGKTSLVHSLAKTGQFTTALEQHLERPYQLLAMHDIRYIFANQMDYLLLRAGQEEELRKSSKIGLMDGGLDLDFHGFTRLFLSRKLLSQSEFDLCQRFYLLIRKLLPVPELIVSLKTDEETVASRLLRRERINIAHAGDTALFTFYLNEWLSSIPSQQILELDVTNESVEFPQSTKHILNRIAKWQLPKSRMYNKSNTSKRN